MTHVRVFYFSPSVCCLLAHWLQREACEPADVHRNSRWSLLEATRLLPGAQDHREDCSDSQPRNPAFQHQSSWNPSASWKQHVSQVDVTSTLKVALFIKALWAYHHGGRASKGKINKLLVINGSNVFQSRFYGFFKFTPTQVLDTQGNLKGFLWCKDNFFIDISMNCYGLIIIFLQALVSLKMELIVARVGIGFLFVLFCL